MRGTTPWWMREKRGLIDDEPPLIIRGFDEDDEDEDEEEEESEEESSEDEDEDEDSSKKKKKSKSSDEDEDSDDDEDEDDEEEEEEDEAAGLKSALKKERQERKKLRKQLKELQKQMKQGGESKEDKDDKSKPDAEMAKAQARAERLAEGFRNQALDTQLERVARKLNFRDPEDVLKLIDRDDIDVEQDEDDPTKVTVDTDDVTRVVKALKKSKPHLVGSGDSSKTKSGSKFGGGKKKTKKGSEQKLKEKYPALR